MSLGAAVQLEPLDQEAHRVGRCGGGVADGEVKLLPLDAAEEQLETATETAETERNRGGGREGGRRAESVRRDHESTQAAGAADHHSLQQKDQWHRAPPCAAIRLIG